MADEGPLPLVGLGLGDLVFMVGEDEVDAAPMDVDGIAQVLHGHAGAFDMPAGTGRTFRTAGRDGPGPTGWARKAPPAWPTSARRNRPGSVSGGRARCGRPPGVLPRCARKAARTRETWPRRSRRRR